MTISKIQGPRSKNQTRTNGQETNSKSSSGHVFWTLKIGSLEFIWCLVFGIWSFAFMSSSACSAAESLESFKEANTAYRTGDYAKAVGLYESLIQQNLRPWVFYYNLGNAQVKLGNLSGGILNYEKALRLDPRNSDIRYNLNYTRGLVEYRVEDTRNWYLKVTDAALRYFTEQETNTLAFLVALLFLSSGILYFLLGRGVFWSLWRKGIFIVLVLVSLIALGKHIQDSMILDAIVMKKECDARYGPSEHDQVAFRMGEGIKVFVMDHREDWSRILLTNGESGWVHAADIAEVKI